jgi:hypothetical protein
MWTSCSCNRGLPAAGPLADIICQTISSMASICYSLRSMYLVAGPAAPASWVEGLANACAHDPVCPHNIPQRAQLTFAEIVSVRLDARLRTCVYTDATSTDEPL